ncbi:MAG: alpha/beta hydrolase [Alphaproteobacteria bacterium]|nr:alpha/beta hydrolase [Alphaproteobacteria bacterium]
MKMKTLCALSMTALGLVFAAPDSACAAGGNNEPWDKVFAKSDKVDVKKVTFKNRFGIKLVGDLYEPKNKSEGKMQAIAVSGPFGAIKEQSSGLYAQTLAERGFVTLAFDSSFTGESGGEVRNVASPDINTDDFSAAVDYLTTLPEVDENKIGIVGICGWGGFALNAAAQDTRIKATVTSTMYDMTRVSAKGYNDSVSADDLYKMREDLNAQRTKEAQGAPIAGAPGLPDKLTGEEPQFIQDYFNYYKTKLGFHPRSINSNGHWNVTSALSLITQPILAYADTIKSPVLMIHGEKAHSRYFSEDAYKKLTGDNKELMIIPNANHTDLYYKMDVIPFDKMEQFFKTNLK